MKQKILVTGANGQLGSELRDLALVYPQFEFRFVSRNELAIDAADKVLQYFIEYQPQYCINCAAYTAVDKAQLESEKNSVYAINSEAVNTLAAVCSTYSTVLIHISTDYVFNGLSDHPYKENDATSPINVYGAAKLLGEITGQIANPEMIIIRTSWVYSSYGKNFVKTMLRLMGEKTEISVVNDQVGCPTYAADLADGIMQIIISLQTKNSDLSTQSGIYNFSNTGVISWFDFAVAIRDLKEFECVVNPISTSAYPTPAKRPMYSVLDTSKIQSQFNIALSDWKSSLKACLKKIAGNPS